MTVDSMKSLYDTFFLKDLSLQNRVAMAPLSRARADDPGRTPNKLMEVYYQQRNSAGLIIAEATHVSTNSVSRPFSPAIDDDTKIASWAPIPKAVQAGGGRIFLQLYHVGRKAAVQQMPNKSSPLAPSPVPAVGRVTTAQGKYPFGAPREMSREEIDVVIGEFCSAAVRAQKAGFDGVEIHAGNGYLIDQFIRNSSNRRVDGYGGTVARRLRLLMEIVDTILCDVPGIRVGVRITPRDMSDGCADTDPFGVFVEISNALASRKIAYLHVSEGVGADNQYNLTPVIREKFPGALIACGGFTKASAEQWIQSGQADLIAFGTHFIANPDLPRRLALGEPLSAAKREYYRKGGALGYVDYTFL